VDLLKSVLPKNLLKHVSEEKSVGVAGKQTIPTLYDTIAEKKSQQRILHQSENYQGLLVFPSLYLGS